MIQENTEFRSIAKFSKCIVVAIVMAAPVFTGCDLGVNNP